MKRASFTLLLLLAWICPRHTTARAPDYESVEKTDGSVEHEVDEHDALFIAKELFRFKAPAKSGCVACTSQDMDYCWGTDLLNDHCCCDHNLPERFPFIPHVCYKTKLPLCQTIANDCEEYIRLDTCCCQPYLRPQWQYYSWTKSRARRKKASITILTNLVTLAILSKCFAYL